MSMPECPECADERTKQAMKLFREASGSDGKCYLTEVAMPGCRPDAVNPDEVDRSANW